MEQDINLDPVLPRAETPLPVAGQRASPEPAWSPGNGSVFPWAQRSRSLNELELELQEARAELAAVHELLEDIPRIFEYRFRQRLQPILDHNAQLSDELQQLKALQAQPAPRPLQLPEVPARPRLRRALRHAFGLGQPPEQANADSSIQAA